jgi:tetratricopeptide (TPR) repeat protein/transcriptional regulator with XRE-family HTH domain
MGPVTGQPTRGFGELLRQLRDEAGLTQEQLAEAAALSARSISDLERGITRTARHETARLLADALGLTGSKRARFEAAARGRRQGPAVQPDAEMLGAPRATTRTLPRDISAFTGRAAELERLLSEVADAAPSGGVVGIHAIGGMAGIGKTTLAVHAAHRLADRFPDGQLFVPLHGHTPGQRPADPAKALASLLLSAGFAASQIPADLDARAACWRDHLAGKRTLLVLDDATGHEQVRPLLPGAAGCLVLVTSRRRLAALEDAASISLDTLAPGEAADLLARLAARPDVRPDDAGVDGIVRLCGYLPLAVGLLGRQLHHHPAWTPAGLFADLAAAHEKLELLHAENVSVAAAFDLSYRDLTAGQRRLFRRLGLHPGAEIDARAAAALAGSGLATARRQLAGLYDLHLITEPTSGRYRLHDLIREYARHLAADDDPTACHTAVTRLLDYYVHAAGAASKYLAWFALEVPLPANRPPAFVPPICTHEQAMGWLETEHANLHAAADYAAMSGHIWHAVAISAAMARFLETRGQWEEGITLFQAVLTAAEQSGDKPAQARALLLLAGMQGNTGDVSVPATSTARALELFRDVGDQVGQGDALTSLGLLSVHRGDYSSATARLGQALTIFRDIGHLRGQSHTLMVLANLQTAACDYSAAVAYAQQALAGFRDVGELGLEGGILTLLGSLQTEMGDYPAATISLRRAQAVSNELGNRFFQARVYFDFGVMQRLTGDYLAAAESDQRALELFGELGHRRMEAYVLDELGRLQQQTGDFTGAAANHQAALKIFIAMGECDGQARVLNGLGELAARTAASQQAREYFSQALALAREGGTPLEEARALAGIGQLHLHDGNTSDGVAQLEQALTLYRRIPVAQASRIEEILSSVHAGKPV